MTSHSFLLLPCSDHSSPSILFACPDLDNAKHSRQKFAVLLSASNNYLAPGLMGWQQLQLSSGMALGRSECECAQSKLNDTTPSWRANPWHLSSLTLCQKREKTEGKIRFRSDHGSALLIPPSPGYNTMMGDNLSSFRDRNPVENSCQWHTWPKHTSGPQLQVDSIGQEAHPYVPYLI